ncbi:hypothetical protein BT69DRAFT_224855 [Atractiella rhizophila]|nr:hypothetical protein BT69DRAFT_224855 [Atractiella rhizophila]
MQVRTPPAITDEQIEIIFRDSPYGIANCTNLEMRLKEEDLMRKESKELYSITLIRLTIFQRLIIQDFLLPMRRLRRPPLVHLLNQVLSYLNMLLADLSALYRIIASRLAPTFTSSFAYMECEVGRLMFEVLAVVKQKEQSGFQFLPGEMEALQVLEAKSRQLVKVVVGRMFEFQIVSSSSPFKSDP